VGNREDLLAGAKRCLYEKGYARTTARDIAAAAGTSLAAIGYHFRSTEALLNTALNQAADDWGDEIGRALALDAGAGADPMERFETIWRRVIDSFATHRELWATSFEMLAQSERAPEVRERLADSLKQGRLGLAEMFQNIDPVADEQTAWAVGSFYQGLLSGVVVQWMVDPDRAPSSKDLADALRIIAGTVEPTVPEPAASPHRVLDAEGGPAGEEDEPGRQSRVLLERLTDQLAPRVTPGLVEPGQTPGDVDDEDLHREALLHRLTASDEAAEIVQRAADDLAVDHAETAVWLGASPAEVDAATTSQAVRARRPELERIQGTRGWLAGHYPDLVAVIQAVVDHADELEPVPQLPVAVAALRTAFADVLHDVDSGSVLDPDRDPPVRRQRLARTVDVHLRAVVELAVPTTPESTSAIDGARGTLAHHDTATAP
jgi:AcrR family transcriptional regulator